MEALVSDLRRLKQHYEGLGEPPSEAVVKFALQRLLCIPPPRGYSGWRIEREEQRVMEDICRLQGCMDGSSKPQDGSTSHGHGWQVVEDHFSTSSSGGYSVFAGSSSGSCSSFFNSSSSSSDGRSSKGSRSSSLTPPPPGFQRYAPSEASESGNPMMGVKHSRPKDGTQVVVDALEQQSRQVNPDEQQDPLDRLMSDSEQRRDSSRLSNALSRELQRKEVATLLTEIVSELELQQVMIDNLIAENTILAAGSLRASSQQPLMEELEVIPARDEGDVLLMKDSDEKVESEGGGGIMTALAGMQQWMMLHNDWVSVQHAKSSMIKSGVLALVQAIALCMALSSIFHRSIGRLVPT